MKWILVVITATLTKPELCLHHAHHHYGPFASQEQCESARVVVPAEFTWHSGPMAGLAASVHTMCLPKPEENYE